MGTPRNRGNHRPGFDDIYENGYSIINSGKKADAEESKHVNQVTNVFYQFHRNTSSHDTQEYELSEKCEHLVVRRGKPFEIVLELERPLNKGFDDIRLKFVIDDKQGNKKSIEMNLLETSYSHGWAVWISYHQRQYVILQVCAPPNCIVGRWKLIVSSVLRTGRRILEYRYKDNNRIFILFNPWCKEDIVHMVPPPLANHYVIDDYGPIFKGTAQNVVNTPWVFGQFEKDVLECTMYLLENSDLSLSDRGDPVKVGRKLTAVVNAPDDNGILVGNWSGNYAGGRGPGEWTGSADIISQYYETKTPVKYGQCWVYSGILTTLCRTLGIPARSVTCFDSAHDTDGNTTIDQSLYPEGNRNKSEDSIWNFHVWNEIWTKRLDCDYLYDGWQALDGTPQERSGNVFRCGPTPVRAVKEGNIKIPYDTPFVFAEVNADILVKDNRTKKVVAVYTDKVGTKILTAYPGGEWKSMDITEEYKYPEYSQKNYLAVRRARHMAENPYKGELDKRLAIDFADKHCMYGEPFETEITIINNTGSTRTLESSITISSLDQRGTPGEVIKVVERNMTISYGRIRKLPISVDAEEYQNKLLDQCYLKVHGVFYVPETNTTYPIDKVFILNKPKLTMTAQRVVTQNSQFPIELSFKNPLKCMLTECQLSVESPKLFRAVHYNIRDIKQDEIFSVTVRIQAGRPSPRPKTIIATFNSKEMFEVRGSCRVLIQKY